MNQCGIFAKHLKHFKSININHVTRLFKPSSTISAIRTTGRENKRENKCQDDSCQDTTTKKIATSSL